MRRPLGERVAGNLGFATVAARDVCGQIATCWTAHAPSCSAAIQLLTPAGARLVVGRQRVARLLELALSVRPPLIVRQPQWEREKLRDALQAILMALSRLECLAGGPHGAEGVEVSTCLLPQDGCSRAIGKVELRSACQSQVQAWWPCAWRGLERNERSSVAQTGSK
eukprot:2623924-Prymnesium_polylepis.1